MRTLCYSEGRYLEHIYTYNHTTCRNFLSARSLWNSCDLLQSGWLGSYSITSKVSNWNQEWLLLDRVKFVCVNVLMNYRMCKVLYLWIYVHIYIYIYICTCMFIMFTCTKHPHCHIGTHAVIILCSWILWNTPKFLIKSCSIYNYVVHVRKWNILSACVLAPGTYVFFL